MKNESTGMLEAFMKSMEGRSYGMEELFDALYWFRDGWQRGLDFWKEMARTETDDRGNVFVAGISGKRVKKPAGQTLPVRIDKRKRPMSAATKAKLRAIQKRIWREKKNGKRTSTQKEKVRR